MKKMSRILSVILAICMVVSLMPSVWATENADTVEILLLDTSDIHGQLYATNYTNDYAQSGTNNQGLTRVATYIKEMRAQYENLYLADTGDTIQGTPLTYYFAFEEDTMPDPTVKAMRTLGYDMWVLGNHEFNYGMGILTEQVDYAIAEATGLYIDGEEISYGADGWTSSALWPRYELDFEACWPTDLGMEFSSTRGLQLKDFDCSNGDVDILVAKTYEDNEDDDIVILNFDHVLSRVEFRMKHSLPEEMSVRLKKISMVESLKSIE